MSTAQASNMVLEQLESALGEGRVPAEAKRRGALLLSRLKSPVRVVVMGKKGAGKSRLLNMLTAQPVMPDNSGLSVLEVVSGSAPNTVFVMEDGTETRIKGLQLDQPVPAGTTMVRAELAAPILERMTLTEVNLSGSPAEQKTTADWALQRADIVLWCTQEFAADEQALWASAPDGLKDHSFLILTKADQLLMKGILPTRIAELQDVVAEEFYSLFPVATIQAISSRGTDGTRDLGLWTTSGAMALVDAVLQLVETGRNADADNALLFLNRYAPDAGHNHRARVPATTSARSTPAAPVSEKPAADKPAATARLDASAFAAKGKAFTQALDFLQQRADTLMKAVNDSGPDQQSFVLEHCLETANTLSDLMAAAEDIDPGMSDIHDDVMECSDMMLLFQLEKTDDAAEDAVTLLLQLKKDMARAATDQPDGQQK